MPSRCEADVLAEPYPELDALLDANPKLAWLTACLNPVITEDLMLYPHAAPMGLLLPYPAQPNVEHRGSPRSTCACCGTSAFKVRRYWEQNTLCSPCYWRTSRSHKRANAQFNTIFALVRQFPWILPMLHPRIRNRVPRSLPSSVKGMLHS